MAGFMKRLFRGMETPAEEKKEAKALKSGSISKKQYVAGEKAEGHSAGAAKKAAAIKSGKLSPAAYAKGEQKEKAMKCGGKVKKMAAGGMGFGAAANTISSAMGNAAKQVAARQAATAGKPDTRPTANPRDVGTGSGPRTSMPAQVGGPRTSMPAVLKAKGGGVEAKGKTAGKTVKMAKGGATGMPAQVGGPRGGIANMPAKVGGGATSMPARVMKKGGSVRGCGIAVKGKTKGKMV